MALFEVHLIAKSGLFFKLNLCGPLQATELDEMMAALWAAITPYEIELRMATAKKCSAQLNLDTFLKELCSYSTADRSPLAV